MGVRIQVTMSNRLAALADDIEARLIRGENLAAERGMALAVERSPWDEGNLAGAHSVVPATNSEEGAAVVVDAPQAARLHENPQYNFSKDANPNAQGKWVEEAMLENRKELGDIIRKEVLGG